VALVLFPARAFLPQVAASSPPGQELHSSRRIAPNLHGNCSGIARELLWIPHAIILPLLTFSSWFPPPPPSLSAFTSAFAFIRMSFLLPFPSFVLPLFLMFFVLVFCLLFLFSCPSSLPDLSSFDRFPTLMTLIRRRVICRRRG